METNTELHTFYEESVRNFKKIFPYVVLVLLLILLGCYIKSTIDKTNRYEQNEKIKNDTIEYFKNRIGTLTATVGTAQLTINDYKSQVLTKDEKLKKLTGAFTKLSTVITYHAVGSIDTIYVPFATPIVYDSIKKDTIEPFKRTGQGIKKDWLTFDYKIDNSGLELENTKANIDITSITGFKRNWFWGRSTATTDITSGTKNVTITNLKASEIVVPKKFYETNLFLIGAGFIFRSLLYKL